MFPCLAVMSDTSADSDNVNIYGSLPGTSNAILLCVDRKPGLSIYVCSWGRLSHANRFKVQILTVFIVKSTYNSINYIYSNILAVF